MIHICYFKILKMDNFVIFITIQIVYSKWLGRFGGRLSKINNLA